MFEKLLAMLPYNPGLIGQMAFYSKRMRDEAAIRRTGMIFVILAFLVQFFAVISPPTLTSAAPGPNNNLLANGFSSAADAVNDCNNNVQDYKNILLNYGISCRNIANSPTITNFVSTSHNRQLFSMGRWNYNKAGEQPVTIDGATYYVRYLWSWDTNGPSTYNALRVIAGDGTTYYLLFGCGNLVSVGVPKPYIPPQAPPPKPAPARLSLAKNTSPGYPVPNSSVAPGTTLGYRVNIINSGQSTADNVTLKDTLPSDTSYVSQSLNAGAKTHLYSAPSRTAEWVWDTVPAGTNSYYVDLTLKINSTAHNGEKICNVASVTGTGLGTSPSNQICMTVVVNAPAPVPTPAPTPSPSPSPVPTPSPSPAPTPKTIPTPVPVVPACLYDTSLPITSSACKPCQLSTTTTDILSCVIPSKSASNITENVADANNTTAQPGDTILYTVYAKNDAKAEVDQYAFEENLGDVLIYASPTDLHGGTLDNSTSTVSWPAVNISPGATASEQITVKIKDPIPSAAPDPASPGLYDLMMTNVYGNAINIKVPPAPTQSIVSASATLPNTGPGDGLFLTGVIVMIAGYFYGRAKLLQKESALALNVTIETNEDQGGTNERA